jgi:hypothetical protein
MMYTEGRILSNKAATKRAKSLERLDRIATRRMMHKFQLNWWNKNVKYKNRNFNEDRG